MSVPRSPRPPRDGFLKSEIRVAHIIMWRLCKKKYKILAIVSVLKNGICVSDDVQQNSKLLTNRRAESGDDGKRNVLEEFRSRFCLKASMRIYSQVQTFLCNTPFFEDMTCNQ